MGNWLELFGFFSFFVFNDISTFVGNLMPNPYLEKNSSDTNS